MTTLSPTRLYGSRGYRRSALAVLLLASLVVSALAQATPALAQAGQGPQLLHLPMRWCVLEGTLAARRDPDAAVLERIRRGSSILAPQAGITLRSALNATLAGAKAFPVIKDPRPRLGRPGDVRVPTESGAEYTLVMQRCAQAWQRLERRAGPGADLGGVSYGPPAVIIRDFVDGRGRPVSNVWGYAFSASSNADYCAADTALIRRASGGSLMVVDSSDGSPSALLDRRLIAHEVGHILRLGHGDGLDNPGSVPGRVDKFCDDSENPDIAPGSLMSRSLSYEDVRSWQRRLPRNVLRRHPAAVEEQVFYAPPIKRERHIFLERIAHDGVRTVRRLLPPGPAALRPLPRLRSAGVRGASLFDAIRETSGDETRPRGADLRAAGLSEAVGPDDGDRGGEVIDVGPDDGGHGFDVSLWPDGLPFGSGGQHGFVVIDVDGDAGTGGSPGSVPGNPIPEWKDLLGVELLVRSVLEAGELSAQAWRWDEAALEWLELDPAPTVEVTQRLAEGDHAAEQDDATARRDSIVISVPSGVVELSERFGMAAMLRLRTAEGKVYRDSFPSDVVASGVVAMSLQSADYPLCALNRDSSRPASAMPGAAATLELSGFGSSGPVSVWLGDSTVPIARAEYQELGCTWPWVTEVTLPEASEPGLQVLQVVLDDSGLTAACAVVVGDMELPDFDAP